MADFGLVGLAVMGENLCLNIESRGFKVAIFNRTVSKVTAFMDGRGKGKNFVGCATPQELVAALKPPRKIMLMVMAGKPVDDTIATLLPFLAKGDIVIDGGNSHFPDSTRRYRELKEKGIHFVGAGVSGGEEGALHGPSIMPGGAHEAWPIIQPIFHAICAKVEGGAPCCDWVGQEGAGHFVKMVHNGIEYGDMQLIAEAYSIMKLVLKMSNAEMQKVFAQWNTGVLDSFLIDITAQILAKGDDAHSGGNPANGDLLDMILDAAGQKGTGKWTVIAALDAGIPTTLIAEAVFARSLSALKNERVVASAQLAGPSAAAVAAATPTDRNAALQAIQDALYASKLVSYAQGYQLMRATAAENGWTLNYGGIALMWRGGCIIRSKFLGKIKEAYDKSPALPNLLLDPFFTAEMARIQAGWRQTVSTAVLCGIPLPAMSSALSFFDGIRSARLPANMIQAQRDFFGAHTFERVDKPRGEFFHCNWTGRGGDTKAGTYTV